MKLDETTAMLIESCHRGKLFAYCASHHFGAVWRLSIVRDGESGHYPISEDAFMGSAEEARAEAHRLNVHRLRLPLDHEAAIIVSSMRSGGFLIDRGRKWS